jgi:hypothetical protein
VRHKYIKSYNIDKVLLYGFSCLYAADEDFFFYFLVYIRIVSVINLGVSIYSDIIIYSYYIVLVYNISFYYVIIMITYLLKCVLVLEFLVQSHFRNPTEFYRIWIVTLCISSNVTEKQNDDYVPFLNCFFLYWL